MPPEAARPERKLHPRAWVALALDALYWAAWELCALFVAVYFWVSSMDFQVVCRHYLALYIVTPIVFIIAGWLAQRYDRLWVYRAGVALHAVYFGTLLSLQEAAATYSVHLGVLLGITWGFFWAGNNTFSFDVTLAGGREKYFGLQQAISGGVRFVAPLLGGLIIHFAPQDLLGFQILFALACVIYIGALGVSMWMPHDRERRPFNFKRAMFPPKEMRDWRIILLASFTLAGTFNILMFLLGLLMFFETNDELSVGGFGSFQVVAHIIVASLMSSLMRPAMRRRAMLAGTVLLVLAGCVLLFRLDVWTLLLFGLLRSIAGPMFGISHFSLRIDVIANSVKEPWERIEYLAAWEVPLAIGRIIMMLLLMGLSEVFTEGSLGIRIAVFCLCAVRILTYLILSQAHTLKQAEEDERAATERLKEAP